MSIEKHLDLLGWRVKDRVSGFEGTVTHVGLDLYGCVQAIVFPPVARKDDGTQVAEDGRWCDVARLERVGVERVMEPIPMKGDKVVGGSDNYKPVR